MKKALQNWLKEWFYEYQAGDGYIKLRRRWRWLDTRETAPWKFWPGGVDQPQMGGYILRKNTGVMWPRYYKEPMSKEDTERFWTSLNYFRNGGKTMFGGPGLNPTLLIGAEVMPKLYGEIRKYRCPKGIYTPNSARTGEVARFEFFGGDVWEGDHPIDYIPTRSD